MTAKTIDGGDAELIGVTKNVVGQGDRGVSGQRGLRVAPFGGVVFTELIAVATHQEVVGQVALWRLPCGLDLGPVVAEDKAGRQIGDNLGRVDNKTVFGDGDRKVVVDVAIFRVVVLDGFNLEDQRVNLGNGDDAVERRVQAAPLQDPYGAGLGRDDAVARDHRAAVVLLHHVARNGIAGLGDQRVLRF